MRAVISAFSLMVLGCLITTGPALSETRNERPILVRVDELLNAYSASGTEVSTVGNFWAPSWSPDGTRFLALVQQSAPNERFSFPAVFDQSGSGRYLFPELPEGTYLYRPIWSPDGRSAALVRYGPSGFAFVIVDVENGEITAEGQIPEKFTAHFPFFTAGIDTFAWSPDGKKVVFSWEGVLVFDVSEEIVHVASEDFALAFWSPDSNSVCMLQYLREGPNPIVLNGLFNYELRSGELREIGSASDLADAGIDRAKWLLVGSAQLSPDGAYVALSSGNLASDSDRIWIFDASPDCVFDLTQPRHVVETDLVPVMEWSPDGEKIAVIEQVESQGPEFGFEVRVVDVETGARTTLAAFELEGLEVEVFGLVGFLAWAR